MKSSKYYGLLKESTITIPKESKYILESLIKNVNPKYVGVFPNTTLWDLYSEESRKYEGVINQNTFKLKNSSTSFPPNSSIIAGELKTDGQLTEINFKTYNFSLSYIVISSILAWHLGRLLIDQIVNNPMSIDLVYLLIVVFILFGIIYLMLRFSVTRAHKQFAIDLIQFART